MRIKNWPTYRWFAVLLTLILALLVLRSPVTGQAANTIYLPLVAHLNPQNPLHTGIATYYAASGDGSCMFGASPNDLMVAAMNADEYDNAKACGAYVNVVGRKGSVVVRIVDLCPGCSAGHLDLSQEAFAKIDDLARGKVSITWQVISPPITGPIAYHFKDGSSQWWTAVQVRNHRNPVAKLEYRDGSGKWVSIPRQQYNYFEYRNMGKGPYALRVTDIYGNVLVDSGIPLAVNGTINGAGQFPYGP